MISLKKSSMQGKGMEENKEMPNLKKSRKAFASTILAATGTVSTAMPASLSMKDRKGAVVGVVKGKLP
jgi:hypothetical protein